MGGKWKSMRRCGVLHSRLVTTLVLVLALCSMARSQESRETVRDRDSAQTTSLDCGDWKPFYWEESKQGRSGRCLEIRIVNPSEAIRGCGADMVFRGPTALPPDREVTVTVWTNIVAGAGDFADAVLGWEPGDNEGVTGGVQDYVSVSRRTKRSGWELVTLQFRSHTDPKVGDMVGLAFGGHTSRATEFRNGPVPSGPDECRGVVAVQPVLSAFFDDLSVTIHD